MIEGVRYINCGDWVESMTAIAEDHSGRFRLIRWREGAPARHEPIPLPVATPAPAAIPAAE
jgi:hypothetical protein